ncbi:MAG: hypothetical protein IJU79_00425 [Desulfovibrionaceae bacterium]|nr:hypothetical protein [Desulfovibrionaceae bacterium]
MRSIFILVLLLICISACTAKHKVADLPSTTNEYNPYQAADAQLAKFIGTSLEGATQTFSGTRYGTGTVTVGRSYHSALNIECREAYIQGSFRSRVAACKDAQQGWILAPEILGEGAL